MSVYKQKADLPAWMKKELGNKYDKYGSRGEAQDDQSDDMSNKYSKYGVNESRTIRRNPAEERKRAREEEITERNYNRYNKYTERARKEHKKEADVSNSESEVGEGQIENNEEGEGEDEVPDVPEVLSYKNLKVTNPANSYYQTFQSNIKRDINDVNTIIRSHYNQRTYQSKFQGNRTKSPIIKLRNFNNIIKYILIGEYCKKVEGDNAPFRLLDLCCGKGGDLNKMEFIKLDEYIGIDISDGSIREAFSRYEKNKVHFKSHFHSKESRDGRKYNFQSYFATGDVFSFAIPDILEPNFPGIIDNVFPVDNVSVQFSLHYAFETEDKIKCLINNISKSLKTGGKFVGTIPSSEFIKYKINKEMKPDQERFSFGNELYKVEFHDKPPEDGDFNEFPFGNGYNYSLTDAIDNVPEYVVPFETLRKICEDNQLILKVKKNFVEFFNENIPKYFKRLNNNLIQSIKRSDGKYGIEGLEKEAIEFYLLFVFEKV